MSQVTAYVLSDIAEADISDIYDYTVSVHGGEQTSKYLSGVEDMLLSQVDHPELGRHRGEIREGLYPFLYEKHIVFQRIMQDHLRIVRILYASRDLPKFIKDL